MNRLLIRMHIKFHGISNQFSNIPKAFEQNLRNQVYDPVCSQLISHIIQLDDELELKLKTL